MLGGRGGQSSSYSPPPLPFPQEDIKRLTIGMIQGHYREKKGGLLVRREKSEEDALPDFDSALSEN